MKLGYFFISFSLFLTGCASYQQAQNIKMVSFTDNISKGKSSGMVQGQDCTWHVLGYTLGDQPTVDKAFINTRNQSDAMASAGLNKSESENPLRYVNNVSVERGGFDAKIFGKNCLVVKGEGFR